LNVAGKDVVFLKAVQLWAEEKLSTPKVEMPLTWAAGANFTHFGCCQIYPSAYFLKKIEGPVGTYF